MGWLVGELVGWLVGELVGWLVGFRATMNDAAELLPIYPETESASMQ